MTERALLTTEKIDDIFEQAEHQADYIIGLYRAVFPDWDNIKTVDGFPRCSHRLALYIMNKAIKFDQHNHTSLPGGAWMNNGFSSSANEQWLGNWREIERCDVIYA